MPAIIHQSRVIGKIAVAGSRPRSVAVKPLTLSRTCMNVRMGFGRRNLTPFQKTELALIAEPEIRKRAKENQRAAGKEKVVQNSAQAGKTRDKVATAAGVSHDTVSKANNCASGAVDWTERKTCTTRRRPITWEASKPKGKLKI